MTNQFDFLFDCLAVVVLVAVCGLMFWLHSIYRKRFDFILDCMALVGILLGCGMMLSLWSVLWPDTFIEFQGHKLLVAEGTPPSAYEVIGIAGALGTSVFLARSIYRELQAGPTGRKNEKAAEPGDGKPPA